MSIVRRVLRTGNELLKIGKLAMSSNRRFLRIPAGHFYSPLPDVADLKARADQLFDDQMHTVSGIDVRADEQAANLVAVLQAAANIEFPIEKSDAKRYYYDNTFFRYLDSSSLYGMVNLHRPNRIVEIGSGYSSSVMLDACDELDGYKPKLTFIEPYPDRLRRLLRKNDDARVIQDFVQDTDPSVFTDLQAGDFLFIDSSHVSKIGSDVNYLFFDVIPRLLPGVFVHVHDVLWPFEYPKSWVMDGRAWNEAYLLRALLTGNQNLQIYLHLSFAEVHLKQQLDEHLPKNCPQAGGNPMIPSGTGIWLTTH